MKVFASGFEATAYSRVVTRMNKWWPKIRASEHHEA